MFSGNKFRQPKTFSTRMLCCLSVTLLWSNKPSSTAESKKKIGQQPFPLESEHQQWLKRKRKHRPLQRKQDQKASKFFRLKHNDCRTYFRCIPVSNLQIEIRTVIQKSKQPTIKTSSQSWEAANRKCRPHLSDERRVETFEQNLFCSGKETVCFLDYTNFVHQGKTFERRTVLLSATQIAGQQEHVLVLQQFSILSSSNFFLTWRFQPAFGPASVATLHADPPPFSPSQI